MAGGGLDHAPGLPVFVNRFIGRAGEVVAVAGLLDLHRMVTLIAPGGVGKTRLAVKVAEETATRWRGGTWFASYSDVTDSSVVTTELASVLGVSRDPGQTLLTRLVDCLPREPCILVLDGCEGVQPTVRDVAVTLLRGAPHLHILATSRDRVDVPGEALCFLRPLPCPPDTAPPTPEGLRSYEASALFEERAAASQHGFAITVDNAEVVARLCRQLDGIPLALELAAARLRMMALLDIESHLSDRFRLLTGGPTERHESLRTTIDWSYGILDEKERSMFRRLSVFPGGFRLDAAAAVLDDRGMDLVDALGRLVDKSLLEARTDFDGRTRYHMLQTIRQYAMELLQESGELDAAMARSTSHYVRLAQGAGAMAESSEWLTWLDRLEAEHDNLLVVLSWAREQDHRCLVALVPALGWFWARRGSVSEGRRWQEAALTLASDDRDRLSVLRWATMLAAYGDDIAAAMMYGRKTLELAERVGDSVHLAHAHRALGGLAFYQQRGPDWRPRATAHLQTALEVFDGAGLRFQSILVMLDLSLLAMAGGDIAAGREHTARVQELARAGGWTYWEWQAGLRFGVAAFLEGNDDEAERRLADCVRFEAENPVFGSRLRVALRWLAAIAARRGERERSARLFGAARHVDARIPVEPFIPRELAAVLLDWQDRVRKELGDAAYDDQAGAGRELPLADLRRLALREEGRDAGRLSSLSRREMQVLELIARGLTNRQVSAQLHLSTRTVDAHLDHIRNKLGLRSRTLILRWLAESRDTNARAAKDEVPDAERASLDRR